MRFVLSLRFRQKFNEVRTRDPCGGNRGSSGNGREMATGVGSTFAP